MVEIRIPSVKEYSPDSARKSGLHELFYVFHREFIESLHTRDINKVLLSKADYNLSLGCHNYNRYVGMLERACHASQKLFSDYDVAVGIARKGMWLSFIFELHGWDTANVLVSRVGDSRIILPVDDRPRDFFCGKRVLLLDNDIVSGRSLDFASNMLSEKGNAESVDALLCYGTTRLDQNAYDQFRSVLKPEAEVIGRDFDGRTVIDTRCMKPDSVGVLKSLDHDFSPDRKYLLPLYRRLGVEI